VLVSTIAVLFSFAGTGRAGRTVDEAHKVAEFIAVGESEVQEENAAEAREKAIKDALVLIFQQGLSSIVATDQVMLDDFEEDLLPRMMNYIDKYQIVLETPDESLYRVEVKGMVSLDRLRETLVGLGVVTEQEYEVTRVSLSLGLVDSYDCYKAALDRLREISGLQSISLHKMRAGKVWLFVDYHGDAGEIVMALHGARINKKWVYARLIGPGEIEMLLLSNDRRPW